jgi:4-alpha-glucanotransferase
VRLTFNIHYHTQWGQSMIIVGDHELLGKGNPAGGLPLHYQHDGLWSAIIDLPETTKTIHYRYLLINEYGTVIAEDWGEERTLVLPKKRPAEFSIIDHWRIKGHAENAFYTSAFQDVIFKGKTFKAKVLRNPKKLPVIQFQLAAPRREDDLQLCICGNIPELGSWAVDQPVLMANPDFPIWTVSVPLTTLGKIEYKYGWYHPKSKQVVYLETGDNRSIELLQLPGPGDQLLVRDEYFAYPSGNWKGTGVAMPVFSLRSQRGFGVGEFTDIKLLADWSKQVGMQVVQILPINDTTATHTWVDSYPYAAISTFALHPLYLSIDQIDGFEEVIDLKEYDKERKKLNKLDTVDYEAVTKLKLKHARALFDSQKSNFLKSSSFKAFFKTNKHWLQPYALFCYLRDKHGTPDFQQWREAAVFSEGLLKKMTSSRARHYDEIAFAYFLQYHLDRQLSEAADYVRQHGMVLKGDIPIGIYRYSVDAWIAPQLYHMNAQAGAPPDPFSAKGQNWGFPTYNWIKMAKDGYQWWKTRLQQLSRYFDTFRIDHILGFFRIWQIPLEQVEGIMGFFNPAIPVYRHEFATRGIIFDEERFCDPYIRWHLLERLFGSEAEYVKNTFLDENQPGVFSFKNNLHTQRQIRQYLKAIDKTHLEAGLFQLVSNVLFFRVKHSNKEAFHPRIDLKHTSSFRELDAATQYRLDALYIDYFYKRQDDFWREQAMVKLPAIKAATNMLICGEDLGMVPDCVPGVMQDLEFLTLEIQRMSKNPATEFLQEADIPYFSVASPSTHDMSPLRAWWAESERDYIQRFYNQELGFNGPAPENCEPHIAERIFQQHLEWPSLLTIFPIQDILAMSEKLRREDPEAERINVPANPQHYWRYRLHLNLEDLNSEATFNSYVKKLIATSGR